jgi:CRP/FNR family cyclic AMP-dependent transcriptional regulator
MVGVAKKKSKAKSKAAAAGAKKSGIKTFKPGDILFNEKDAAESLYIIQRGQIRLYIPKGRGFVEICILRAGEVIGEMGYFDEKSRRRSCSAAAIVTTEVVEISYNAFEKTMQGLNPWFKTIINTLAERLRKTNDKVRQLESNSVGFSKGGKVSDYKFFHNSDIIRILTTFYLTLKTHGEVKEAAVEVHQDKVRFYLFDVYNVKEVVYEEMKILFEEQGLLKMKNDEAGQPKIMSIPNVELYRNLMVFFNTQRMSDDTKALKISSKCEKFLKKIIDQMANATIKEGVGICNISVIMQEFATKKIPITEEDLADAHTAGFTGDVIVGDDNIVTTTVQYNKLVKAFPAIKLMNAINKVNESKAGH